MDKLGASLPIWTARSPLMVPGSASRGLEASNRFMSWHNYTITLPDIGGQNNKVYKCKTCIDQSVCRKYVQYFLQIVYTMQTTNQKSCTKVSPSDPCNAPAQVKKTE